MVHVIISKLSISSLNCFITLVIFYFETCCIDSNLVGHLLTVSIKYCHLSNMWRHIYHFTLYLIIFVFLHTPHYLEHSNPDLQTYIYDHNHNVITFYSSILNLWKLNKIFSPTNNMFITITTCWHFLNHPHFLLETL